jgi:hypothetical protein
MEGWREGGRVSGRVGLKQQAGATETLQRGSGHSEFLSESLSESESLRVSPSLSESEAFRVSESLRV